MLIYLDPLLQFSIFILSFKSTRFIDTCFFSSIFILLITWLLFIFPQIEIFTYAIISLKNDLVNKIISENTNFLRNSYFIIINFLFIILFINNMFGLFPYMFSITATGILAFFLAFIHFFAINLLAIWEKKWKFLNVFLPNGVPVFLIPLVIIIEIISYFSRLFSLSIRLMANIVSGHTLLKILIGFSWKILNSVLQSITFNKIVLTLIFFFIPWFFVTLIFFLEILIAFLQSYIFIVLLTIYVNDVTNNDH